MLVVGLAQGDGGGLGEGVWGDGHLRVLEVEDRPLHCDVGKFLHLLLDCLGGAFGVWGDEGGGREGGREGGGEKEKGGRGKKGKVKTYRDYLVVCICLSTETLYSMNETFSFNLFHEVHI